MEVIKVENREPEITLKLTLSEFNTMVVAYGGSSNAGRVKSASIQKRKILEGQPSHDLFRKLECLSEELSK